MPDLKFSSLPLAPAMLTTIAGLGYEHMTAIQAQSLPFLLEGRDLLAQAETGSGKTAAFAIALLQSLNTRQVCTQALVLCPTRELADQVGSEVRRLAVAQANTKLTLLCGGKPFAQQLNALEQHPPHIVVGTPGRLMKHLQKGSLKLENLKTLVLDEADRMLDMGFYDDILRILEQTPATRQTLLFSATYPEEITAISARFQNSPAEVRIAAAEENANIKQIFYEFEKGQRTKSLITLLQHYQPDSALVFCNRKFQCQELTDALWQQGFHALALHGDLDQSERDQVVIRFANKSSSILVATDVAARGLDIKDLDLVINFELSPNPEVHVHRIGRTGRAGQQGLALSLYMPSEAPRLTAITDKFNEPVKYGQFSSLKPREDTKLVPSMVTLMINGGRKDKLRPGDILGALTAEASISGKQIGKIDVSTNHAYVAVERPIAKFALKVLTAGKIKGRKFRVRKLR